MSRFHRTHPSGWGYVGSGTLNDPLAFFLREKNVSLSVRINFFANKTSNRLYKNIKCG